MLKPSLVLVVISSSLFMFSCASNDEHEITHPYQEATSIERMTIPEGMDNSAIVDFHPVPKGGQFDDGDFIYEPPLPPAAAIDDKQQVKLQKLGSQAWVYTKFPPSQVWPRLKQYLYQESFAIDFEDGRKGIIHTVKNGEPYRFKLSQGFQSRSSELHVRMASLQSFTAWPESPIDAAKEQAMLEGVTVFLTDTSQSPAYSFAAQGISIEKKLFVEHDEQGVYQLKLVATRQRAMASLKMALELADFGIESSDMQSGIIKVRYMPKVDEEDQPGFFMRIIGFNRKEFNEDIIYAGHYYQFSINSIDKKSQKILIAGIDQQWKSDRVKRNELNAMMRFVKSTIH